MCQRHTILQMCSHQNTVVSSIERGQYFVMRLMGTLLFCWHRFDATDQRKKNQWYEESSCWKVCKWERSPDPVDFASTG